MIDPPERNEILARVAEAMELYDARRGPAVTRWQRFRRRRHLRLVQRRLYDRHALRHS